MSANRPAPKTQVSRNSGKRGVPGRVQTARGRQRERILDAAARCFIQSGFHAASIANIAQAAQISQGLIYRYFHGKASIVKAIIERQLESDHFRMIGEINSADEVCRSILETLESWRRRDDPRMNAVLMLELSAESTRDAEIARAVQTEDEIIRQSLTNLICRGKGGLAAGAARSRAVLLQCLVEGVAVRVVRDPGLDTAAVKPALEAVIANLLG